MDENSVMTMPRVTALVATRAKSDVALMESWLQSLGSPHSARNFETTARRFLEALAVGLREAAVEDVREALIKITEGRSDSTARQYVLRVKSFLSYAHKLGYTPFNAGVTIKVRPDQTSARLAERIIPEVDVKLLIRAASKSPRDRALVETLYAGGLRVSEAVTLRWRDVIARDKGVQLSVTGKGGRVRQVLLPEIVSRSLIELRGASSPTDAVFTARHGGALTERAVHAMIKRAAKRAGVSPGVSPHWLRHAHGSHALDRGATIAEVQTTLGHANVATTSGYLHARPDSSSGLRLDKGIFR
ncbi:integrase/recombinase XerD [Hyphomicrobium sp. 1Nfss2.1]|uniref:tyrosine-type recombinase/integrase n=1 Tax=Hyphomicrobium sp. 1Nfss2.1 TaxID=3413936 RepID=UPI003C7BB776